MPATSGGAFDWSSRIMPIFGGKFDCSGLVAQWITRLTTDQKIPGSNPGELVVLSRSLDDV